MDRRYLILEGSSADELAQHVNKFMQAGWEPQGGVSVTDATWHEPKYAQAMMHEDSAESG